MPKDPVTQKLIQAALAYGLSKIFDGDEIEELSMDLKKISTSIEKLIHVAERLANKIDIVIEKLEELKDVVRSETNRAMLVPSYFNLENAELEYERVNKKGKKHAFIKRNFLKLTTSYRMVMNIESDPAQIPNLIRFSKLLNSGTNGHYQDEIGSLMLLQYNKLDNLIDDFSIKLNSEINLLKSYLNNPFVSSSDIDLLEDVIIDKVSVESLFTEAKDKYTNVKIAYEKCRNLTKDHPYEICSTHYRNKKVLDKRFIKYRTENNIKINNSVNRIKAQMGNLGCLLVIKEKILIPYMDENSYPYNDDAQILFTELDKMIEEEITTEDLSVNTELFFTDSSSIGMEYFKEMDE